MNRGGWPDNVNQAYVDTLGQQACEQHGVQPLVVYDYRWRAWVCPECHGVMGPRTAARGFVALVPLEIEPAKEPKPYEPYKGRRKWWER